MAVRRDLRIITNLPFVNDEDSEDGEVTPRNQWGGSNENIKDDFKPIKFPVDCIQIQVEDDAEDGDVTPRDQPEQPRHAKKPSGGKARFASSPGKLFQGRSAPAPCARERTPSPENYFHPMVQKPVFKENAWDAVTSPQSSGMPKRSAWCDEPVSPESTPRDTYIQEQVQPTRGQWRNALAPSTRERTPSPENYYFHPMLQQQAPDKKPVRQVDTPALEIPSQDALNVKEEAVAMPEVTPKTRLSIASLLDVAPAPPPPAAAPRAPVPPASMATMLQFASLVHAFQGNAQMKQMAQSQFTSQPQAARPTPQDDASNCGDFVVSAGSVGHPNGCGEPCKYARKGRGCKDGASCRRCHLCKWSRYA